MRKPYIDNIRNFTILLLFPVHTFMIWNDFGNKFYIWLSESKLLSILIVFVNPWFMPILFVIAGMSARYALEKKTVKEFIIQRLKKLFVPFIFGLIFLVPIQTLYARKFYDNYMGDFWDNWKYFFTHCTDFSGYDGAFSPGQLWFILFLFGISLFSLIIFYFLPYNKISIKLEKTPFIVIILLFLPVWIMYYLGNIGGFSIGKYLALYLISYYFLSNDKIMEKIENKFKLLMCLSIFGTIVLIILYYIFSYYGDLWVNFIGWIDILMILCIGKKYFNKETRMTKYFNAASYPIYILHQSVLVALAYYIIQYFDNTLIQVTIICLGSFLITEFAYHLIKLIPIIRKAFGIK